MKAAGIMRGFAGLLCLVLLPTAWADMIVEKETSLSDLLKGMTVSQETILLNDGVMAINEHNARGLETKTIVRNQGEELLLINYSDLAYSQFDQYLIDSLLISRPAIEQSRLDSLKAAVTVNALEVNLTGNLKAIGGLEAEEVSFIMDMECRVPIYEERLTPVRIVVRGVQWVAGDFRNFENYRAARGFLHKLPGRITGNIFGDYSKLLKIFNVEQEKIARVADLLTRLMLEGQTCVTIQVGPDSEDSLEAGPIPAMTWTVRFDTRLISISFEKIPDEEFAIPKGFQKVHNAFDEIGDFVIPSLEKWFALDKKF